MDADVLDALDALDALGWTRWMRWMRWMRWAGWQRSSRKRAAALQRPTSNFDAQESDADADGAAVVYVREMYVREV